MKASRFPFNLLMIVSVLLVSFLSCKNHSAELTRSKAFRLIKQKNHFPQKVYVKFSTSYLLGPLGKKQAVAYEKSNFEKELEKMGYAHVEESVIHKKGLWGNSEKYLKISYLLTDEGKKIFTRTIDKLSGKTFYQGVVGELQIDAITGIRDSQINSKSEKIVEYTVVYKNPTKLLVLDQLLNKENSFSPGLKENRSAFFVLYDDGWRCNDR